MEIVRPLKMTRFTEGPAGLGHTCAPSKARTIQQPPNRDPKGEQEAPKKPAVHDKVWATNKQSHWGSRLGAGTWPGKLLPKLSAGLSCQRRSASSQNRTKTCARLAVGPQQGARRMVAGLVLWRAVILFLLRFEVPPKFWILTIACGIVLTAAALFRNSSQGVPSE